MCSFIHSKKCVLCSESCKPLVQVTQIVSIRAGTGASPFILPGSLQYECVCLVLSFQEADGADSRAAPVLSAWPCCVRVAEAAGWHFL